MQLLFLHGHLHALTHRLYLEPLEVGYELSNESRETESKVHYLLIQRTSAISDVVHIRK